MSPRMICLLSGFVACASTDPRLAWAAPTLLVVGALGAAFGLTRPRGFHAVSDAVLYEAHRTALVLNDYAGADAIRAELRRREEVPRG